ncbi:hypothetical protein AB6C51_15605 [Vibrio splendidus]
MKKVLMVCYGGGHVKIIEHLYHEMRNEFDITILGLTSAGDYLKSRNIPYVGFSSFPFLLSVDKQDKYSSLVHEMNVPTHMFKESLFYMGANLNELECKHGKEKAKELFNNFGRDIFYPIEAIRKIVRNLSPDLVITTNSPRSELASLEVAHEFGIPSLCISDNIWIHGGVLDIANSGFCKNICVFNDVVKNKLVEESGIDESYIKVTGNPVFDELKELSDNEGARSSENKIVVTFIDGPFPEYSARFPLGYGKPGVDVTCREKLNNLGSDPDITIYFRKHPNQNICYDQYRNVIDASDMDLHQLLLLSDVVVTSVSTVGLEGLMLGCTLLSIEDTVYKPYASYYDYGLSQKWLLDEEFKPQLVEASQKERRSIDIYSGRSISNIRQLISDIFSS